MAGIWETFIHYWLNEVYEMNVSSRKETQVHYRSQVIQCWELWEIVMPSYPFHSQTSRNLQNASGIKNKMSLAIATGQIYVEVWIKFLEFNYLLKTENINRF